MVRQNRKAESDTAVATYDITSAQELVIVIEAGRKAAAESQHEEAITHFEAALASSLLNDEQRATVRCSLAESLEYLARYREAIVMMAEYENAAKRTELHPVVLFQVWLRMGSAYGYAGDHPRAISYLKEALKLAEERHDAEDLGACHLVLGRIYRAIGETEFARDHLRNALQYHRALGQWQALAQTYFLMGNVCVAEGDFHAGRDHFEQAIKIIGDRRAPLLLGSIYTNLSNLIFWREHGQASEGIEAIEKAIFFLKQARNERILAYAYSNLGYGLGHVGEWSRAEQALQQAIEIGGRIGDVAVQGTALDTLGEIRMLRGDFVEAEEMLRRAVANAQAANSPMGEEQALQTLGRCSLMRGDKAQAIAIFEKELEIATKLKDKRLAASARLHLAEAWFEAGDEKMAHRLLEAAAEVIEPADIVSLVAHFRLLSGLLRARAGGIEAARHHFSQAITIYEMIADPYQEAVARYHLGFVSMRQGQAADRLRAGTELQKAHDICLRLGAQPLLQRIEAARQADWRDKEDLTLILPSVSSTTRTIVSDAAVTGAEVLRLIGALASRELLLQELVTLVYEAAARAPVVVFDESESGDFLPVATAGITEAEAAPFGEQIVAAIPETQGETEIEFGDATLYRLRTSDPLKTMLYVGSPDTAQRLRTSVEPLARLAEVCLELGVLREKTRGLPGYETYEQKHDIHLPGLVLASQPMQKLAEDIHKIRGSRVTALITGESGTGKELVARAIHKISDRRNAPFVPFNCTVAPREIIASQLFGHRKGAFTGAVSDYQGVIRSADGGTLFLDEVGDLAPEVQPQLLRFLQEGEIQPLGETRPIRVDVRVLAATNADIEKLVAEGKFREDLYYRLNIIRLHIPSLRDRREEIPVLVDYFLKLYASQAGRSDQDNITITPQALDLLMVYDWPGNVRQLANEMQRLVAYAPPAGTITERDLSSQIFSSGEQVRTVGHGHRNLAAVTNALLSRTRTRPQTLSSADDLALHLNFKPGEKTLDDLFTEIEREVIADALRRHNGHRENVARELGITRKGLYLKLQRLKMDENGRIAESGEETTE